jgi:hypothetical protein
LKRLSRPVVALTVVLGLAVSASKSPPIHAAFVREPAQQKLVYQTTWQHGKIGWSSTGTGTWQVQNGELSYDGSGESALMAPISTRGRRNYAVQMTAQALDHHGDYNGTYGFGIIFRSPADPDLLPHSGAPDSLGAGVVNTSAVVAGIYVYPQRLASSDFEPGLIWHTYRIEVRGTIIRLLIDGQLAAHTRSTRFFSRTGIGLFSIDGGLTVKSFKVFAL